MSGIKDALEFISKNCTDKTSKLIAEKALEELENNYDLDETQEESAVPSPALEALAKSAVSQLKTVATGIENLGNEFEDLELEDSSARTRAREIGNLANRIKETLYEVDYDDLCGDLDSLEEDVDYTLSDYE